MKIQCCVCKRVQEEGKWKQAQGNVPGHYSHTYCPDCLREALLAVTAGPALSTHAHTHAMAS